MPLASKCNLIRVPGASPGIPVPMEKRMDESRKDPPSGPPRADQGRREQRDTGVREAR